MSDFKVRKVYGYDPETCEFTDEFRGWEVYLPHQCDSWQIAPELGYRTPPATNAEAQWLLRAFLDDGERAMEALKAEQEYGVDG